LPPAALGVPELDADPAWRLAAAFLLGYRGHTRRAYFTDIRAWYTWCAGIDLPPLAARRHPRRPVDRRTGRTTAAGHRSAGRGRHGRQTTVLPGGLYEYAVVDVA